MTVQLDLDELRDAEGFYPDDILEIIVGCDPDRRRVSHAIREIVVTHSRFEAAYALLKNTLVCSKGGQEGECALIYGKPGVGKSTVLNAFEAEFAGPFKTRSGLVRPVLRINIPGRADLSALYKTMLAKLDAAEMVSRDVQGMKLAVLAQLKNQRTRMLILDEFTHVVEDRTEFFTKKVVRELKGFISENVCDVVFVGTDEITQIADLYEQIQRRGGQGEMHLLPFDFEDADDNAEWFEILETIGEVLPVLSRTPLHDRRFGKLIPCLSVFYPHLPLMGCCHVPE
jgi:predicted AAA+ superfamily ATPase